MKRKIIITLGMFYVTIAYGLATFCTPVEVNRFSPVKRQACEVEQEDRGGDGHSGRLFRPAKLSKTSEHIDGKSAQHRPSTASAKEAAAKDSAADKVEYPPNYLLVWTAEWCKFCPQMKVIGDKLKAEGFDVFYIDFDENQEEAKKSRVGLLPTAIVYTDDEEVKRVVGINSNVSKKVEARIRSVLEKNGKKTVDYAVY